MCGWCSGVCWSSYHNGEISGGVCWVVLQHLSVCTHTHTHEEKPAAVGGLDGHVERMATARSRCFPTFKKKEKKPFFSELSLKFNCAYNNTHTHTHTHTKKKALYYFFGRWLREVCASPISFLAPMSTAHICWHFSFDPRVYWFLFILTFNSPCCCCCCERKYKKRGFFFRRSTFRTFQSICRGAFVSLHKWMGRHAINRKRIPYRPPMTIGIPVNIMNQKCCVCVWGGTIYRVEERWQMDRAGPSKRNAFLYCHRDGMTRWKTSHFSGLNSFDVAADFILS
jgi:hypothetical protein